MTIRYDMHEQQPENDLIVMFKHDISYDVGRKYTFDPKLGKFRMHFENVVVEVADIRDNPDANLYLQMHGQGQKERHPIADLDYQPIAADEINWL